MKIVGPRLPDCDRCDDEQIVLCDRCDGYGKVEGDSDHASGWDVDCSKCGGSGEVTCPACRDDEP